MTKTPASHSSLDLLPWAVNHTLTEAEQCAMEEALRQQPDHARELNHAWQQVRAATLIQPQQTPAAVVRQRVLAQADAQTPFKAALPRWLPLLSGVFFTLLTLIVLWSIIQPGIGLQWSVQGAIPMAFRIYRAPLGSDHFEIVREVPAHANTLDYSFTDTTLWPGLAYQYRIEAVNRAATSATIAASGTDALLLQIAIAFSSLMIGLATTYILRQAAVAPPSALRTA